MKYRSLLLVILLSAQALIACGAATPEPTASAGSSTDLSAIKTYLTDKTNQLATDTTSLEQAAQRYYDLASARQFDYATLWKEDRDATAAALADARSAWLSASPTYEQMEGIVAGVPALAQFDVDLDAGTSAQESAEDAVSFDLSLANGTTLSKPGNLFGVLESTLWGTYADYTISAVDADLNGNGKLEFGEGLPEANVLLGGAQKLHATASELQSAAQVWTPSVESAFNALVVMIPTMNEYFESWKNSRFVAGADSDQRDFVAISRLADVQNILGSLQVVYTSVQPLVAEKDPTQAAQINKDLAGLKAFVADVYTKEQSGQRFTPEEADLLGAEAQDRATAITGTIAQMAGMLNVPLSE